MNKPVKDYPELIQKPPLQLNNKLRTAINQSAVKMSTSGSVESLNPDELSYLQAYLEQLKVNKMNQMAQPTNLKYCTSFGDTVSKNPLVRDLAGRRPINQPYTEDKSTVPTPRDVQPAYPGPMTDYVSLGYPQNRMNDIYDPIPREMPVPGARGCEATRNGKKTSSSDPYNVYDLARDPIRSVPGRTPYDLSKFYQPQSNQSTQTTLSRDVDNFKNFHNPYSYGAKQNEFGSIYKPTYTGPYNVQPDLLTEMGIADNLYWEKFPGDVRNVNVESSLLQRELTHGPGQRELTEREVNRFEMLPFDPQDTRHIIWRDNMPRGGYPTRVDRLETI
jgi:hypothetical protein